jgi:hypothetical protein
LGPLDPGGGSGGFDDGNSPPGYSDRQFRFDYPINASAENLLGLCPKRMSGYDDTFAGCSQSAGG